eukprot:1761362-Pleurochrysis_carterae.AAC.1
MDSNDIEKEPVRPWAMPSCGSFPCIENIPHKDHSSLWVLSSQMNCAYLSVPRVPVPCAKVLCSLPSYFTSFTTAHHRACKRTHASKDSSSSPESPPFLLKVRVDSIEKRAKSLCNIVMLLNCGNPAAHSTTPDFPIENACAD